MTSLPIMWYGCFDFEKKRKRKKKFNFDLDEKEGGGSESGSAYNLSEQLIGKDSKIEIDKDDYLENPALYKIGLT